MGSYIKRGWLCLLELAVVINQPCAEHVNLLTLGRLMVSKPYTRHPGFLFRIVFDNATATPQGTHQHFKPLICL